ncbi:type I-E CRISPR-associated endonuclease Cas1e [Longispora sp. NPDC051575]|uniref:type I-E CRISPR-associated endonuclease Cas1e n=1 Tax=Longispora sp. NPDC051575 TaxID=3154943 RepID=UPI003448E693
MLPKIADSLSFLYLDVVRVVQDDTGVCAQIATARGTEQVYLPTAALSCVLLGPGTSITQPALATLARHGTTVLCTGSGGVRCYSGIIPDSLTSRWLELQARRWADDHERLNIAIRMYEQRFGTGTVPAGTTLAQLRGMEGQRIKALYRVLAQQHRIGRFRRSYDPASWDQQDPVNLALSSANTCLYGIVHAAIQAMGCSPGLGFVHSGTQNAFVYDIADLYKAHLTIPLAFGLHDSFNPEQEARRSFRSELRLFKLMPRIVNDIQRLLTPDTPQLDIEPDGTAPGLVDSRG